MSERTTLEDTKRWLAHLRHSGADLFCEATRPAVTPLDLLEADHMMKHEVAFWEGVQRAMDELASKRRRCLAEVGATVPAGDRATAIGSVGGRLLVYTPELEGYWQLNTGSRLVDKFNVPAWDTWVGVSMPDDIEAGHINSLGALIAWIPPCYREAAEDAISGAVSGELAWIEERHQGRVREWAGEHGLLE